MTQGSHRPDIVRAVALSKRYRKAARPAIERVDLRVEDGEFVFLTGESGSGKSTLIRTLLLEHRPTTGDLHLFGRDTRRLPLRRRLLVRRNIGTIFQDYKLLETSSALDNVTFPLESMGESRRRARARAEEALSLVGLADKTRSTPRELSGGEQQRVAVARAIVTRPRLILADEPTGNLDPDSSAIIFDLLGHLQSAGTTVVVATHDAATVDRLERRVVRLDRGAIVSDRTGGYR